MNITKQTIKRFAVILSAVVFITGIVLAIVLPIQSKTKLHDYTANNDTEYTADPSQIFTVYNTELMKMSANVAATAETKTVLLTATLLPATTQDKTVDWAVTFVNPNSAWAKGKNAADYVSVVPTSDGALTANVSAKAGFGEQVKITVTSRVNENATAYCVADYGKRLSDTATLTFENQIISMDKSIGTGGIQTVEAMRAINWQALMAMFSTPVSYTPAYNAEYTKSSATENIAMSVRPVENFYNSLKAKGLAKATNTWTTVSVGEKCANIYDGLCSVNVVPTNGTTDSYNRINLFNEAIFATTAEYDFEIKIAVTTDFETKEYLIPCKFNRSGAAFTATSAKLSQENIVL